MLISPKGCGHPVEIALCTSCRADYCLSMDVLRRMAAAFGVMRPIALSGCRLLPPSIEISTMTHFQCSGFLILRFWSGIGFGDTDILKSNFGPDYRALHSCCYLVQCPEIGYSIPILSLMLLGFNNDHSHLGANRATMASASLIIYRLASDPGASGFGGCGWGHWPAFLCTFTVSITI